jgi:RimJ/RimL family protein N-acetyltransferase
VAGGEDLRVRPLPWRPAAPLTTRRLRLRPLSDADVPALLAYRGDPEVCRYLPFAPMTREVLAGRLATDLGRTAIAAPGEGVTLGAERLADGRLIGDVVLFLRSAADESGELGYVFHPDVAGQGYATEACTALLDAAFDSSTGLGLQRVVARIEAPNLRSARVAARLGMWPQPDPEPASEDDDAELLLFEVSAQRWRASRNA